VEIKSEVILIKIRCFSGIIKHYIIIKKEEDESERTAWLKIISYTEEGLINRIEYSFQFAVIKPLKIDI